MWKFVTFEYYKEKTCISVLLQHTCDLWQACYLTRPIGFLFRNSKVIYFIFSVFFSNDHKLNYPVTSYSRSWYSFFFLILIRFFLFDNLCFSFICIFVTFSFALFVLRIYFVSFIISFFLSSFWTSTQYQPLSRNLVIFSVFSFVLSFIFWRFFFLCLFSFRFFAAFVIFPFVLVLYFYGYLEFFTCEF